MSKYCEDEAFENYMADPLECKSCVKKDKLIIKHWEKNDQLREQLKISIQYSNKLIMENCKLKDQLKALNSIIN